MPGNFSARLKCPVFTNMPKACLPQAGGFVTTPHATEQRSQESGFLLPRGECLLPLASPPRPFISWPWESPQMPHCVTEPHSLGFTDKETEAPWKQGIQQNCGPRPNRILEPSSFVSCAKTLGDQTGRLWSSVRGDGWVAGVRWRLAQSKWQEMRGSAPGHRPAGASAGHPTAPAHAVECLEASRPARLCSAL